MSSLFFDQAYINGEEQSNDLNLPYNAAKLTAQDQDDVEMEDDDTEDGS
jgi:hypothetical protein